MWEGQAPRMGRGSKFGASKPAFALTVCACLLLAVLALSFVGPAQAARRDRPRTTYFNMKTTRRSMIPDLHIPRLFRSNSGATKPMKKSQLAKAKGSLLRYQYVHSTYSKAIEGKRRVVPRAYDRKIELDMPSNRRRTGPTAAERAKKTALSTILVKRNARNRNKTASMKD